MYLQISPILGCWGVRLGLAGVVVGSAIAFGSTALAQVVPDNTLGGENSVVTSTDSVDAISGGATRERNLFHSFDRFSVPTNSIAFFNNPTEIQNIFSRVTGGSISNIDGLIKANGTANLFLLNPNGIVFGQNAQLNIGGSFVASTANAIQFGEQGFFSATDPNAPPLLTVNPSAFLFNQARAAAIENNSKADAGRDPAGNSGYFGLKVPFGRSLLLVGGDIKADGGGIAAFGGHVDLAAVAGTGTVGLNVNEDKLSLSVPDSLSRADVLLNNKAGFIVSAGGGGDIAITARNISIDNNSSLNAGILSNFGSEGAQAGDINLNATEAVALNNNSEILNSVFNDAVGNSGNINITTGSLSATNAGQVRTQTVGRGNAGDITIEARDSVSFDGRDNTDSIPSAAFTSVELGAIGNAGDIYIKTGSLSISDRAQLLSNTEFQGDAGDIAIEARDRVSLFNSIILSEVSEEGGVGNGGDINIKTGTLLLKDGSALLADLEHQGDAGDIKIEARDAVILEGIGPGAQSGSLQRGFIIPSQISARVDPIPVEIDTGGKGGDISISSRSLSVTNNGFISVSTFSKGDAGSIDITTDDLSLTNGAQIGAGTFGRGNGGNLTINARESIKITGRSETSRSGIFAPAIEGSGDGGDISIISDELVIEDEALISVSNFPSIVGSRLPGTGTPGSIDIEARSIQLNNQGNINAASASGKGGNISIRSDSLTIDNGSSIEASNRAETGEGGNIALRINDKLLMRNNSQISATANRGEASGGNINIDTRLLIAAPTENNDIVADAVRGRGGNISINAEAIFGIQQRSRRTPLSDITASSELGVDGTVQLNSPEVDPSRDIAELPTTPVDASTLVSSGCPSGAENRFGVAGRGGLPPSPGDKLSTDALLTDWATLTTPETQNRATAEQTIPEAANTTATPLVEATTWQFGSKGEIILTNADPAAPNQFEATPSNCPSS
jgi:filamentous hemagglutinin family protein